MVPAHEVAYTWRGRGCVTAAMTFIAAQTAAAQLLERAAGGEPIGNVRVQACGEDCPRCGARSRGQTPEGVAQCTRCLFIGRRRRVQDWEAPAVYEMAGTDLRGIARAATITATPAGIAGLVERWYREGWRNLVIHRHGKAVGWIIPADSAPRGCQRRRAWAQQA